MAFPASLQYPSTFSPPTSSLHIPAAFDTNTSNSFRVMTREEMLGAGKLRPQVLAAPKYPHLVGGIAAHPSFGSACPSRLQSSSSSTVVMHAPREEEKEETTEDTTVGGGCFAAQAASTQLRSAPNLSVHSVALST
eukprot:CAMPEP_0206609406 /NCGR_PEP_ID=MMETSP0325_2-20121206/53765_1 /ASSEMBLY_ACC=CAM_ASM_000347 /TAXON_ID=2866 /ORGANISM="Crypthecodinium cohnii, Strain Seligo" /LENGTH=135 /DNA_ID=CAMNT_0054127681 /DNA_START=40 /DNA_END=443 /DNA_ORIENTATION=+